jgi:adhesin/invasin
LLLSAASLVTAGPVDPHRYFRPKDSKTEAAKPKQAAAPVVVNAASYLPGISPGGLATIFGQDLSSVTGIVYAGVNPLPTQLAGVSVTVNGVYAPLYGVALADDEDQISFQVPYETPVGLGVGVVEIFNDGVSVATIQTDSYTEDPGIFLYNGNYAIAELPDYSLIGTDNPASPGDTIVLYTTGLGPLTLDLVDGYGSPTTPPFAETVDPFQVVVQGEQCGVVYSGLAPGFVGLYQVNFVLPSDLPAGNLNVQIFSQYSNSGIAILPVQ